MQRKTEMKIAVDVLMTIGLLFLMTYNMLEDAFHEWIGTGMMVLLILHHMLNGKWSKGIFRGKYTAYRIMQTLLVVLVFLTMLGSMASGIILSRHVFSFLGIDAGRSIGRTLHLVCAYWNLVLMSLHLGLHWSMMIGMAKRLVQKPSALRTWILRGIAFLIAVYSIFAFMHRDIGSYMLLQNEFVFFDYGEPLYLFLLDYLAIMGAFVLIGHYLTEGVKHIVKMRKRP